MLWSLQKHIHKHFLTFLLRYGPKSKLYLQLLTFHFLHGNLTVNVRVALGSA